MHIIRTIIWVIILVALFAFSVFNWESVEVTLWENLVLETKVPALVIIAFLLGLVPMWLYHRSVKWSLSRRIRSLENSVKSNALSQRHAPASSSAEPAALEKPAGSAGAKADDNIVDKPVEDAAKPGDSLTPTDNSRDGSNNGGAA